MLAQRPTNPKNRWQAKPFASTCALLTTLLFSHLSFAADVRTDYDLDDDGLIEINDLADLDEIRNNLDGKSLYGSNAGCPDTDGTVNGGCIGFELTTDLDFDTNQDGVMDANDDYWNSGYGWSRISSNSNNPFTAIFDGNGHVIRNLFINTQGYSYPSLFGIIKNAVIRNLGLTGPLMSITGSGSLVAQATYSEIKNVFNTGPVQSMSGSVGGLIGILSSSTLENAVNSGRVRGNDRVGGLVGSTNSASASQFSTIRNGLSTGLVNGSNNLGGLIGTNNSSYTVIENSYWASDASGQNTSPSSSEINSYAGLPLATLQCAVAANTNSSNSNCVSADGSTEGLTGPMTLFNDWDQALLDGQNLWDFGSNTQLPALALNDKVYRDSDGDSVMDNEDAFPQNPTAFDDSDADGNPNSWSLSCDANCIASSGLQLDQFPDNAEAWQDEDLDGQPDSWGASCDAICQNESNLVLDAYLNDTDNDGIDDLTDTDDNNDGITDIDTDSDGLVEINNLAQLHAMRNQLDGAGLRTSTNGDLDQSGCPAVIHQGVLVKRCVGYELTTDLDFDTNQDGIMDANDTYWSNGAGWTPIGSGQFGNYFTATFEGNGYVIHNLFINRSDSFYQSLFGSIRGTHIRNVGLTGSLMRVKGYSRVGALVGESYDSIIESVFNTGSVEGQNHYTGSLVGILINSRLINSSNTGSVFGDSYIGGLVGSILSYGYSQPSLIRNSISTGMVSGNSNLGGLASNNYYSKSGNSVVENSYWATDSSGQTSSYLQSEANSYVGLPLERLQCAVQANTNASNSSCVSEDGAPEGLNGQVTLFKGWGEALIDGQSLWDFGSDTQIPVIVFNGIIYRDSDGDSVMDNEDAFPQSPAAFSDTDADGHPDSWSLSCDVNCITNSGLQLDQFPSNADAWQDEDLDGQPDSWGTNCDASCQNESNLVLDAYPNDTDNDGIDDLTDTDDNNDGVIDIDTDSDGLVEINNLAQLNAMRNQLDGGGLRMAYGGDLEQSGCPAVIHQGVLVKRCIGYELTTDLDFDTNQDGIMDANDTYWNSGYGWRPIGSNSTNYRFTATFEGNGHVMRNLFINRPSYSFQGLFAYTENALIRNLGLTGPLMSVKGSSRVGALVGLADESEITNVFNIGPVIGTSNYVGGLVGYISSSTLENAVNSGRVSGDSFVGGLVGRTDVSNSSQFSTIRNGLNTGLVKGNSNSGGLAGYTNSYTVFENSYWASDASGQDTSTGESEANSYVGLPLAMLQCAVAANTNSSNSSCVSADGLAEGLTGPVTLFKNWDQALLDRQNLWDFGSNTQIPALALNYKVYRDSDGDSVTDDEDVFPQNPAAFTDFDADGHPDSWSLSCNASCIANSGLQLDQFPDNTEAWQDDDLDGQPDSWGASCDASCQNESNLVLDAYPNDTDNDGIDDLTDTDDNNDGVIDIDADGDGLVEINNLAQLNAMRYQLDGGGLRVAYGGGVEQSGCPAVIHLGVLVKRCSGYELTTDLDFDTNQDGIMDANDTYWNNGAGWSPIGSSATNSHFTATLEGNGHVMRNLFINRPSYSFQGLFAYTENALIRNLGLTGPLMSVKGSSRVGALVGLADESEITNVFNTGPVVGRFKDVGGLVGYLSSSTLENAANSGRVSGDNSVGGLIGSTYPASVSQFSTIRNGLNTGLVNGSSAVGGLIGYSYSSYAVIENSYWASDASGQDTSAGSSEANSYVGLPVATLKCAVTANTDSSNSSCVSADGLAEGLTGPVTLFKDWDQAMLNSQSLWDFGSETQTPAMVFNNIIYHDSDGDFIVDAEDFYPHISLEGRVDTDNDGIPNECDESCTTLGMTADLDDDNDGVLDVNDAFPLIAIGNLLDTDNDGAPNTCDLDCLALSMTADLDDDNDGVLDSSDAYPLISLGGRVDSDLDGIPNQCDANCIELGMAADLDDDNDGLLDVNDTYPLVAIGELLDTDNDGAPNSCDTSCVELGMSADLDDDNDGVLDTNDVYPLIAIGELLDTDNDGAPNTCDLDCLALGMVDDLDDDNDGVLDSSDVYPLISLGDRVDSDLDGIPNQCDANCFKLGMAADLDDDNDGLLDVNDTYPLVAIGELLDTDNDGAPNTCDVDCLALGMTADSDDDNDGVLDINDAFPLIAIGNLLDTDNDGAPDTCDANCLALNMTADLDDDNDGVLDTADAFPLDPTEHSDFDNDGTGDVADLDDDNDGVNDVDDPNLGEDNGKPEIINVPSIEPVAVTTENGDAFELLVDDNFLNAFTTYDAVDTEFTYEASLNGNVLAIDENDIMLIPAGRQAVQVVAIDAAGNRSEPVEMVAIVYPQVRFEQATSIIGENSTTNIKVSLTGDAPDYPVVINFAINELSYVNQADLDAGFDITAQHQVIIEAGDGDALNRDGFIKIGTIEDNESENDELLIVDLVSAKLASEADDAIESLFLIDETNMQHELTVTYQNLAPVVNLKLEQNGIEVANVQQDAGMVSITAIVQDGNGNDIHTLTWDLNNLGLNAPLGNILNFSPAILPVSTYEISVIATDNGVGQLSGDAMIRFDVVATETNNNDGRDGDDTQSSSGGSGGSGGGSNSLWFMLFLFGLTRGLKKNRRTH